jgi:hypothetical protein
VYAPETKQTRKEKMTEKQFRKKVIKFGGEIKEPSCLVSFPNTICVETQSDAIDLLDIMRYGNDLSDTSTEYTVDLDTPLEALKAAIIRGST